MSSSSSSSNPRKRKKTTAHAQSQPQPQLQSTMEVEDLNENENENDQAQIDNNSGNSNDSKDKEKSIASLCNEVLEKEIAENKDALFTLLGLEEDDAWNQEIVEKLIKFLRYLDLVKFINVRNLYDDKEEDDFNKIIGKEFVDFQKQNPNIKSGILLQYKELRETLQKYTMEKSAKEFPATPPPKSSTEPGNSKSSPPKSLDDVKIAIKTLLHEWLRKLPKNFHVGVWDKFKPGFPKQPGLVMPLDLTVYKQNNKEAKTPSMIIYGLEDLSESKLNFTNANMAKYIESTAPKGSSCIYGVSGSGKTRGLYEYAARHYSMYFVASGSDKDLGSYDLYNVMQACKKKFIENGNDTIGVSKYAQALVYARLHVFSAVCEHCERTISSFEWLLLQLSPLAYGGTDIFKNVARQYRMLDDLDAEDLLEECVQSSYAETFYVFVDEAQNLFDTCKNKFLSSDNKSIRSLYTALITNLSDIAQSLVVEDTKRVLLYPVTAGTGLKYGDLMAAIGSEAVKIGTGKSQYDPVFPMLDHLKEKDVYAYLEKFIQLDKFDERYVDHVCRWLKGRPRFAATFVQTLMMFEMNLNDDDTCNGAILNHLNEFIRALCLPKDSNFPENWSTIDFQRGYFYNRLESLEGIKFGGFDAGETIRNAVIDVMFSFKAAEVGKSAMIVEYGLGYVDKVSDADGRVDSIIFEPIVIQAAIQYFESNPSVLGLDASDGPYYAILVDLLRRVRNTDAVSAGFAFERFVAFNLHCRCDAFLGQYEFMEGWSGENTVGKLAFGSLVEQCATGKETMDWFTKIRNATAPGFVPPICFPDRNCGPDLIFFLTRITDQGEERMPVLVQVKYSKKNQDKAALDSTDPNQFYRSINNPDGWDNHKRELFINKAVLRIVLQFRAKSNLSDKVVVDYDNGGVRVVVDENDTEKWEALFTEQHNKYLG